MRRGGDHGRGLTSAQYLELQLSSRPAGRCATSLFAALRTGRAQRRPRRRLHGPGELRDMVLLSERPLNGRPKRILAP
jgi:hypothetical protein